MMTAEQLKGSILQLAMQGKLVEQRTEEGTGEELYKEIQTEKKRLLKEGSLKKQKSLSVISDGEVPFDIPDTWKWVHLGDITELIMGQSPKGENVFEGGQGIEFHQGKIYFSDDYLLESTQTTNAPTKIVEPNTVLLCVRAPVGTVNITPRKICIGRGLCGVRVLGGMDSYFMLNWLRAIKDRFVKKATGTTFIAITGKVVEEELIPLPPLGEQKRIVAKIEELMPFVEQYAAASTKLNTLNATFPEMMKKSILQEAVQGKLVPQDPNDEPASLLLKKIAEEKRRLIKEGKIKKQKPLPAITEDEIPFDIPDSWEWVRFGDIYTMSNGIAKRAGTTGEFIGVLRLADLSEGVIDTSSIRKIMLTEKEQQAYLLKRNDLIMIRVNGSKGKVGTAFVYDHIEKTAYCDHLFRARSIGENICPKYIALVFNTAIIRNTFKNEIKTTAGQNTISQESMKNVLIPLPPMCEQERIVDRVCEILPSISLLRE